MAKKSKKGKSLSLDFEGVKSGGGMAVADGNYLAYPEEVTEEEGESSGEPYLKFKWKIVGPKSKGAVIWDNCSLQPQALWRLKTILELFGEDVPDGAMELDVDDLIGEEHTIGIEVTNENYKGKAQPRITGFSDPDGAKEEGEEEEEEEKPKSKKDKGKSKEKDDDDDDDDGDDDDKGKGKKDEKLGKKPKIKVGSKVRFEDDDGKSHKGTVTEIDGDEAKVEDKDGDEWEIDVDDLELI
jgi:hypothetical protein